MLSSTVGQIVDDPSSNSERDSDSERFCVYCMHTCMRSSYSKIDHYISRMHVSDSEQNLSESDYETDTNNGGTDMTVDKPCFEPSTSGMKILTCIY